MAGSFVVAFYAREQEDSAPRYHRCPFAVIGERRAGASREVPGCPILDALLWNASGLLRLDRLPIRAAATRVHENLGVTAPGEWRLR